MKSLDRLALFVGGEATQERYSASGRALILYDPCEIRKSLAAPPGNATGFDPMDDDAELDGWFGDEPKLKGILGIMLPRRIEDDLWMVERVVAIDGYGPLLYTILAEIAAQNGAILIPSESRSDEANHVWGKFGRNPFVRRVTTNRSPLGFGIEGNGTLDLTEAVRTATELRHEIAPEDHHLIVRSAGWWCDMAMKLLD